MLDSRARRDLFDAAQNRSRNAGVAALWPPSAVVGARLIA
jgi:hypothetical protein